jgi:hypothetical protein
MPRILLLLPLFLVYSAQVPAAALPRTPSTPANWAQTLERIASGVVTIQIDSTRAFDTEWNTSAQATGFVIDAKRGLILTNRHVVTPGPVTAQATFQNREEVQLYPVYRDPVHDFGIYRRPNSLSIPSARRSAGKFAWSETMPASSYPYWPARWRGWIGKRRNTATASTTTSTRSTIKRRPARPGVLRVRR